SQHWLRVPQRLQSDAAFVLYLSAVGFALNMCLTVFGAIPQGLQRLDLFAMRSLVLLTVTGVAQITIVMLGGGLRWLAGVTVAINVASLVIFVLVARRLLPGVSLLPRFNQWASRELLSFGALRFVNQLAGQVVFQLDRLIVAALVSIAAVTFYSVPLSIAQRFVIVQAIFATAFFPAASELHALADRARLRAAYLASMKLVLAMVVPMAILVATFSHPLLKAWLGNSFADASAGILAVLAVAYGLAQVMGVPTLAADATGHVRWSAGFAIVSAAINLSLTIILVPRLGAIGAADALLINGASHRAKASQSDSRRRPTSASVGSASTAASTMPTLARAEAVSSTYEASPRKTTKSRTLTGTATFIAETWRRRIASMLSAATIS